MSDAVQSFFTLLQVAVGARSDMGRVRSDDEWAEIYGIARMHKLEALVLSALDRVPAEQMPSKRPMMRIFADAQKVRLKNARFNAELQVVADNTAAVSLYRSTGFSEYGRNPKGFRSRLAGWQELLLMRQELR